MQVIQEAIIEKAKKFIANNKGKLAALAGLAALGGGAYVAYKNGMLDKIHLPFGGNSNQNTGAGADTGADTGASNGQSTPKEGTNTQTNGEGSKTVSPLFKQNTGGNEGEPKGSPLLQKQINKLNKEIGLNNNLLNQGGNEGGPKGSSLLQNQINKLNKEIGLNNNLLNQTNISTTGANQNSNTNTNVSPGYLFHLIK